ncbi:unnamed protein product [Heligmosomoides polygyrus]|uniref:Sushi domain-containing protein n=1 Tax=Heligmosomoides polygyrus TaxID=6339 RepID=A0A183F4D2_HELPZ|nr:unnamed protein product [Heligmosomoides polygyrus]
MFAAVLCVSFLVSVAADGSCVKLTPGYHTTLRYDRDPLTDGTYPTSTKVVASCNDGLDIIYGSTEATCNNGSWDAQLGRCPYHCSLYDLVKVKNFTDHKGYYPVPYPKVDLKNDWRRHGTGAYAYCAFYHQFRGYEYMIHYLECKDGGWQPWSTKWPSCKKL